MDGQLSITDELEREARARAVEEIRAMRYTTLCALLVERGHTEQHAAGIAWGRVYGSAANFDV